MGAELGAIQACCSAKINSSLPLRVAAQMTLAVG
jgi:hypothetical protein